MSPPDSPQPSTSGIQSGSVRPSNHELGYSLQPRRAYDAVKFGIKGTDYTIVLKNAGTRHYQQLVNEYTSIVNDIVDETLGTADPNDYVRFVLKSSDFDRPLNTSYQRQSQVSGAWLSELAGKLLQSHESLDLVSGSSVQCLIAYAIYPIAVIVQNLSNQITSVLLK